MTIETLIGSIAAALTTICFVPQTARALRTRDTAAISLPMYVLFTLGVAFWLAYGILLSSTPIIAANTVTLCLAAVILACKIRYG